MGGSGDLPQVGGKPFLSPAAIKFVFKPDGCMISEFRVEKER